MSDLQSPVLSATHPSERIMALDVARGLALFGIFMVNVQMMTQPIGWLMSGAVQKEGPVAHGLHLVTRVLFESKSYPLFSMLFGMGMALMYQRARALNRPFVTPYLRRLFLLAAFGLAHALLIWYGDILFYYFMVGLVAMWFVGLRPRTLLIVAAVCIAIATVILAGMSVVGAIMTPEGAIPETTSVTTFAQFWQEMKAGKIEAGPVHPAWMAGENDAFANGPFLNAVGMRAINWLMGMVFWLIVMGTAPHILAMFLIGIAIMKSDPFSAESRLPGLFVKLGLFVGLPGAIAMVTIGEWSGVNTVGAGLAAAGTHVVGPCVSLGYFGLAILLARRGAANPLVVGIASAGRLGLTNYIMQSVVVAAFAQHWGFGHFGDVSRTEMVVIVLAVYAFQIAYSPLYLRCFAMGPLEYLWRTGIYLRLPRLRAPRAIAG